MSGDVHALIAHSLSDATRRAYRSDMANYEAWGGIIPSTPKAVAEYLAELSATPYGSDHRSAAGVIGEGSAMT